jgi:hypothetical protein
MKCEKRIIMSVSVRIFMKSWQFFLENLKFFNKESFRKAGNYQKTPMKVFSEAVIFILVAGLLEYEEKNSLRERWAQSHSSIVNELWTYCTYLFQWCAPAKGVSGEYCVVQHVHCTIIKDILYNELKLIRVKKEVKERNGVRENDIFKGAGWKTESKSIS